MTRRTTTIIRSQGEPMKRGYAVAELPAPQGEPARPMARVVLVDPRRTVTRTGAALTSPSSELDGQVWPPPKPAPVEFPEKLPGDRRQQIIVRDPDVLTTWERATAATQGLSHDQDTAPARGRARRTISRREGFG